jgi:hypothetical protein
MRSSSPARYISSIKRIPAEARIAIVTESSVAPASEVREKFRRVKPLKDIPITQRGWTLDVLNALFRRGELRETQTFPVSQGLV